MSITPYAPQPSPVRFRGDRRLSSRALRLAVCLMVLVTVCASLAPGAGAAAETPKSAASDSLLPLVGGALVEAGGGNWDEASAELEKFEAAWGSIDSAPAGEAAAAVSEALTAAKEAVRHEDADDAKTRLSTLAKQVNEFIQSGGDRAETDAMGKEAAGRLLKMVNNTLKPLESGNPDEAQSRFKQILDGWSKMEGPIRSGHFGVYSDVETHMSLVRIALQADPVKTEQAAGELQKLADLLQNYIGGKLDDSAATALPAAGQPGLEDAIALLKAAAQAAAAGDAAGAAAQMQAFIVMWPRVEGEVSISSPAAYTATENRMTEAQSYLLSSPPDFTRAANIISQMLSDLEPLAGKTAYTAWDAALVLLREGLEAILVLAALLAFAKRANQPAARRFIWAGAGSGLALSAALAVVLTYAVAQAVSGGARELLEGFIGLAAVVMMLAVGHFLHSKSSAQAWNQYIAKQFGGAMERGSLWSLFVLSGLAILREGAETAVFYIGMAPSIELSHLLIGMLGALAALAVLGFALIRFSVKLPIKPFMLTASLFIYFLVIRFTGESLHALQVAGVLPAHSRSWLPAAGWVGAYPTWETFLPQSVLLLFVLWRLLAGEKQEKQKHKRNVYQRTP